MFPITIGRFLVGTVILGIFGMLVTTLEIDQNPWSEAAMWLEPQSAVSLVGQSQPVTLFVKSQLPVNAFSGLITFDPTVMFVASIDYNTTVVDLWVEKPWYENGAGTINFAGGTTKPGGFTGKDWLLKITFIPMTIGHTDLSLEQARILKHDGLGTDVVLPETIDALFTVETLNNEAKLIPSQVNGGSLKVVAEKPNPDLNGDGKISASDVSIMLFQLLKYDPRYDLNGDGKVSLADLSIILDQKNN